MIDMARILVAHDNTTSHHAEKIGERWFLTWTRWGGCEKEGKPEGYASLEEAKTAAEGIVYP